MPRMAISEHAVERFIEHVAPDWGYVKARHYLEEHAATAVRLPGKTLLGQQQYELADPPCVLVVKRSGGDDVLTCVTVFPPRGQRGGSPLTELEAELLQELASRPKPQSVVVPPAKRHWPAAELRAFLKLQRERFDWERDALEDAGQTERARLLAQRAKDVRAQATLHRKSTVAGRSLHDERMARHIATQDATISTLKKCLRPALRYAVARAAEGDVGAIELLDLVRAVEDGFLSDGFLSPKPKAGSAA